MTFPQPPVGFPGFPGFSGIFAGDPSLSPAGAQAQPGSDPASPPIGFGYHTMELGGLSGAAEGAFTSAMNPAEFEALVESLIRLQSTGFCTVAARLARALGIATPLPVLTLEQRNNITDRMNAGPSQHVDARELLCLLDAAGRDPGPSTLHAPARAVWQGCFRRAVERLASTRPSQVPPAPPVLPAPPVPPRSQPPAAGSRHPDLSQARADVREGLAAYGMTGAKNVVPGCTTEDFERDQILLKIAKATSRLCRKLDRIPIDGIHSVVVGSVLRRLEKYCHRVVRTVRDSAQMFESKLTGFSKDVATACAAADAAIKVAGLAVRKSKIVSAAVADATDSWLASHDCAASLVDPASPRASLHKEVADHWRGQLHTWRRQPDRRDELLDNPGQLLPANLSSMLEHAWRFPAADLGANVSQGPLGPVRHELEALFDRCMSSMSIEGYERQVLAEVFTERLAAAIAEWTAARVSAQGSWPVAG